MTTTTATVPCAAEFCGHTATGDYAPTTGVDGVRREWGLCDQHARSPRTTTQPATVRRTSVYTLRVPAASTALMAALRTLLDTVICDHGDQALSWRSTSDADAVSTATIALDAVASVYGQPYAVLTTGLGVHLRDIAVQDAGPAVTPPASYVQEETRRGVTQHAVYVAGTWIGTYATATTAEAVRRKHAGVTA